MKLNKWNANWFDCFFIHRLLICADDTTILEICIGGVGGVGGASWRIKATPSDAANWVENNKRKILPRQMMFFLACYFNHPAEFQ